MKSLIYILAIPLITCMATHAAQVIFGSPDDSDANWNSLEQVLETDGSITFIKAQDDALFRLNIRGVANYGTAQQERGIRLFDNGAGLGVIGNGEHTRITCGTRGVIDDEYIILTLSIDGKEPASLSLESIHFRYIFSKGFDLLQFIDHLDHTQTLKGIPDFNFQQTPQLTPLTIENIDVWQLAAGSVNRSGDLVASDGMVALGQVTFNYTPSAKGGSIGLVSY